MTKRLKKRLPFYAGLNVVLRCASHQELAHSSHIKRFSSPPIRAKLQIILDFGFHGMAGMAAQQQLQVFTF